MNLSQFKLYAPAANGTITAGSIENDTPQLFNLFAFIIYITLVLICQYTETVFLLNSKCPRASNYYIVLLFFLPWIFMFLALTYLLTILNAMGINIVAAFSDVYGYWWVSRRMNETFSEIMYPSMNVKQKIEENPAENINSLQRASQLITEIAGRYYKLVNEITPWNFTKMIASIQPLCKGNTISEETQKLLYSQVMARHNIGECAWYLYTGILVCVVVSYLVTTTNCNKTASDVEKDIEDDVPPPNDNGPRTVQHDYSPEL